MDDTAADTDSPCLLTPQPAGTLEDLRSALALAAPQSLPAFDAERTAAAQQARETVNVAPLRRFAGQWSVYVAIERQPHRAARLRELEVCVDQAENIDEVRALTAEIGRILDAAFAEAGGPLGGHDAP